MDAWPVEMKDGREDMTACQEATEAYPEKMKANSEKWDQEWSIGSPKGSCSGGK
jgi:hypothetical protein